MISNTEISILEEYFDNMVSILKDVNGATYTDKEYRMAALYGLDNAGPWPSPEVLVNGISIYDLLKNAQQKTFDDIKTKYSITTSDLTTFNQSNTQNVPANKKVRTICP